MLPKEYTLFPLEAGSYLCLRWIVTKSPVHSSSAAAPDGGGKPGFVRLESGSWRDGLRVNNRRYLGGSRVATTSVRCTGERPEAKE